MDNFNNVVSESFSNSYGNDEFAIGMGSKGARVEQLKKALTVLGEDVDEKDFGAKTRNALIRLNYPPSIIDANKFNEIILRAYKVGKKEITLTEPQLRALYEKEVSVSRRDTLTFDKWLARQNIKHKIGEGGKKVFDVLFGWLQMRARGVGSTGGVPAEQPIPTGTNWFSKTSNDSTIPNGVYLVGGIVGAGLLIWGIVAVARKTAKVVYVQSAPVGA